jgi:hypothetical protein
LGIPTSDTDTNTEYSASRGLVLTGTTFSIDQSLIASKNYVDQAVSGITASNVADNTVTSAKILDGTITNQDIAATTIEYSKLNLASQAIPFSKIAIAKADIVNLGIPTSDTDTNTEYSASRGLVLTETTFSIDQSIIASKNYVDQAVSGITASSVADNSITSEKIINGSINNLDISESAGISFTKLAISDLEIPYAKLNIPAGSIAYNQMTVADYEIPFAKLNIPAGSIAYNQMTVADYEIPFAKLNIPAGSIAYNQMTVADYEIPFAKLNIPAGSVGYNQLTVADSEIPISKISIGDGSISGTKIENGTITSTNLAANSINGTKIEDQSITGADIATNSIPYPKLLLNNQEIPFTKLNILKSDIVGLGIPESDTSVTYNAGAGMQLSDNTFSIANTVVTKNYNQSITINATLKADELKGDGSGITNINGQNIQDSTIQYSKLNLANRDIETEKINSEVLRGLAGITVSGANQMIYTTGGESNNGNDSDISFSVSAISDTGMGLIARASTQNMKDYLGITTQSYSAGRGLNLSSDTFSIQDTVVTKNYNQSITINATLKANELIGNGSGITNINGQNIQDSTIQYSKLNLANGAIPFSKLTGVQAYSAGLTSMALSSVPSNRILYTIGTNSYSSTSLSSTARLLLDDTSTSEMRSTLGLVIGTNVHPFIQDGGLSGTKLQAATITSTNMASDSINGAKIQDQSITGADIASNTITYPKLGINDQEIPFTKLNILKSDIVGLGIPENDTDTTYTAGRGLNLNGTTFSIASTVVTNNYVGAVTFNARVVANQFIGEGSRITGIDGQNIQDSTIQYTKLNISNGDIPLEKVAGAQSFIVDGELSGIKLQAATITSINMADNSINGAKIQNLSINARDVDSSIITSNYKILATNNDPIVKFSNDKSGSGGSLLGLAFTSKTTPTATDYYITFSDSSGPIGELSGNGGGAIDWPGGIGGLQNSSQDAIAFNNSRGVVLQSTGADYAEYIERQNPTESFSPCDIVGIKNGKVVSSLEPADQFMVISQRPIVIGNAYEGSKKSSELVSFIGQIYVKVRGSVQSGQYIIASNNEAGVGIAKDGDKLTRDDYSRVIGKAWETSPSEDLKVIKVGMTTLMAPPPPSEPTLKKLEEEIFGKNKDLKGALKRLKK